MLMVMCKGGRGTEKRRKRERERGEEMVWYITSKCHIVFNTVFESQKQQIKTISYCNCENKASLIEY
jgi:hypothetical protein